MKKESFDIVALEAFKVCKDDLLQSINDNVQETGALHAALGISSHFIDNLDPGTIKSMLDKVFKQDRIVVRFTEAAKLATTLREFLFLIHLCYMHEQLILADNLQRTARDKDVAGFRGFLDKFINK